MAEREGVVDIYNCVRELRSRRVNMVQTEVLQLPFSPWLSPHCPVYPPPWAKEACQLFPPYPSRKVLYLPTPDSLMLPTLPASSLPSCFLPPYLPLPPPSFLLPSSSCLLPSSPASSLPSFFFCSFFQKQTKKKDFSSCRFWCQEFSWYWDLQPSN